MSNEYDLIDGGGESRSRWSSYDSFIDNLSRAVVRTAEQVSTMTVEIATSVIAISSIAPELIGLHAKTGSWLLAVPVALTGIGSVHAAVMTKRRYMWAVFALHFLAVEGILFYFAGLAAEMAYPLISVVGAIIMASAVDHKNQVKRNTKLEDKQLDFTLDEKRKDNELRRQIKLEKERAALSNDGVKSSVKNVSNQPSVDSGFDTQGRQSELLQILQSIDAPEGINRTALARQFGVSRQTIYNDLDALQAAGRLSLNGHVEVRI